MGLTKTLFMEDREYFELMSEEEFEDSIHAKYGYGIHATMKLATGDTSTTDGGEYLMGEKVTLFDLDNLFSCADEDDE